MPRVAIVGMSALFPGAANLARYAELLRSERDALGPVPARRAQGERGRGGFVDADATFDPGAFGLSAGDVHAADPEELLVLRLTAGALRDAGVERPVGQARIGFFLSRSPSTSPIAAQVAKRLELRGPVAMLDAGGAGSLMALGRARDALARGEADLMLVAGVHVGGDVAGWPALRRLGLISPSEAIRPFASDGDGTLLGEGLGVVVLERVADARRARRRIYAALEGSAIAGDWPAALRAAWAEATAQPEQLGLLEANGCGIPADDALESAALEAFFSVADDGERAVIATGATRIGHTLAAAGIAGVIAAALAIYDGIRAGVPWPSAPDNRVAAVNAASNGGVAGHAVLRGVEPLALPAVLTLAASSPAELLARLERGERDLLPGTGPARLAIVAPDERKLAIARTAIAKGTRWSGQQIFFSPGGMLAGGGKLTFLFPGLDASFAPDADALARFVDRPLPPLCAPLDYERDSVDTISKAVLEYNAFAFEALRDLGVRPDALAGHSLGEWSALAAAASVEPADWRRALGELSLSPAAESRITHLALAAPRAAVEQLFAGLPIAVSHDNCDRQVIVCGDLDAIAALRERALAGGIFATALPFRGGFHSPHYADVIAPHRTRFAALEMREPATALWSAATARRAPSAGELNALMLELLVQPVRFRELIEALYADGQRVFVQVGAGSLPGFVGDVLRGRPHLTLRTSHTGRGIVPFVDTCAGLWVEGAAFDARLLSAEAVRTDEPGNARGIRLELGTRVPAAAREETADEPRDPLERLVRDTLRDIDRARQDVLDVLERRPRPSVAPRLSRRIALRLDADTTFPELHDHSLVRLPSGWPILADRNPVVPLTMEIALVREALEAALPGKVLVELRNVRAQRWLRVAPPVTAELVLEARDDGTFSVAIDGHFDAVAVMAEAYPATPSNASPLRNPRAARVDATALYRDNWKFHGPAYQGITHIDAIGDDGIDGVLTAPAGKGGLLDSLGQLAGCWLTESPLEHPHAMPVGIDRLRFFAPEPPVGARFSLRVRVRDLDERRFVTEHRLTDANGRVIVTADGWTARRYPIDRALFDKCRAATEVVSHPLAAATMLFVDHYDATVVREYLAYRFTTAEERAVYEALPVRRRRSWLNGRIAVKDAVRALLAQRGTTGIFPQEMRIQNAPSGQPCVISNVSGRIPAALHISLAHKERVAVAIASDTAVGIDIERIAERPPSFDEHVAGPEESQFLAGDEHAIALTRAWVAKEAAGKRRGTGLAGNPRALTIDARAGDVLRVDGAWVATYRLGDYIVGWTVNEPADAPATIDAPRLDAAPAIQERSPVS